MCRGQVLPATHQQPLLPFDEPPFFRTLSKEFRLAHFVDSITGVLHDVELVVDDLALWRPLLDAQPKRLPHVDTRRLNAFPLPTDQLSTEILIQRLLPSLRAKP